MDPEVLAAAQVLADQRFLCDKVAQYDLVRVRVLDTAGPQTVRALVERIYSTGNGLDPTWQRAEIEFVYATGWGFVPLRIGDRAFVFVCTCSDRLYEAWSGHLVIEDIEGVPHAIFQAQNLNLWASKHLPEEIRGSGQQDPRRPYASAFRFDAMEAYLIKLIAKIQQATPPAAS